MTDGDFFKWRHLTTNTPRTFIPRSISNNRIFDSLKALHTELFYNQIDLTFEEIYPSYFSPRTSYDYTQPQFSIGSISSDLCYLGPWSIMPTDIVAMKVETAKLCYSGQDASPAKFAVLRTFGTVDLLVFDRSFISFSHTKNGTTCTARLPKGTFTIQNFASGCLIIQCHERPKCYLTGSRGEIIMNSRSQTLGFPLGQSAKRMYSVKLSFSLKRESWTVSGAQKAQGSGLENQLKRFLALYPSAASGAPLSHSATRTATCPESTTPSIKAPVLIKTSASGQTAAESPHHQVSSHQRPTNVPVLIKVPESLPPPNRCSLPKTHNSQTESVLPASTTPATSADTPSISVNPQHPASLKPKLKEMVLQYDAIEHEESKEMASCEKKKRKLWEDWFEAQPAPERLKNPACLNSKFDETKSAYNKIEKEEKEIMDRCREKKANVWQDCSEIGFAPKNPQHPANLKRKLDDMTAHYDDIEKKEKEFMARCRESKKRLWERFHDPGFQFKPL